MHLIVRDFCSKTRSKIRRFSSDGVQTFVGIRITKFLASYPDVIWNSDDKRNDEAISAVEGFDRAESIFEIISSGGIEEDTIKFKPKCKDFIQTKLPDSPELPREPIDMPGLDAIVTIDMICK